MILSPTGKLVADTIDDALSELAREGVSASIEETMREKAGIILMEKRQRTGVLYALRRDITSRVSTLMRRIIPAPVPT